MRAIRFLFLVFSFGVLGCGDEESDCAATQDCPPGTHCVSGLCGFECRVAVDCREPDTYCDGRGRCIKTEEGADSDVDVDMDVDVDTDADVDVDNGCPDFELPAGVPSNAAGSTVGEPNAMRGSCRSGTAPDVSYGWNAPFAGTFAIDTNGSDFDTVLYVRDGACGGPELACDDDGGDGTDSRVTVDLGAGQRVFIIVDGYGSYSGNYQLNVDSL